MSKERNKNNESVFYEDKTERIGEVSTYLVFLKRFFRVEGSVAPKK